MFYWSSITRDFKIIQSKESTPLTQIWDHISIFIWEIHGRYPQLQYLPRTVTGRYLLRKAFSHVAQMCILLMNSLCFKTKGKSYLRNSLQKRVATVCFFCTCMTVAYFKKNFPFKMSPTDTIFFLNWSFWENEWYKEKYILPDTESIFSLCFRMCQHRICSCSLFSTLNYLFFHHPQENAEDMRNTG
jgi:hypothetical protein